MTDPVDQSGQNGDPIDAQFEPAPPSPDHVVIPDTPRKGPGWLALIVTGILASLVGAAAGAQFGSVLGSNAAPSATGSDDQAALIDTLSDDQKKLGSRIAALQADLESAESRLADQITDLAAQPAQAPAPSSAQTEDLSDTLAALSARVDLLSAVSGETETGEDLGPLSARMLAFEQALANVQTAQTNRGEALAGLSKRIEAAETTLAETAVGIDPTELVGLHEDISSLKTELAEAVSDSAERQRVAALIARAEEREAAARTRSSSSANAALAMLSLQTASERGTPFTDVIPVLEAASADAALLADLRAIAPTGAPTLAQLQTMFEDNLSVARTLTGEGTSTQAARDDDGWGWVRRTFGDSVKITRSGSGGDDALEDTAALAAEHLASGNIAAALAETDSLTDAERASFAQWRTAANHRQTLDAAIAALQTRLLEQEQ